MLALKKIIIVFVFLLSTIVQGQEEKLPSYFSNQETQLNNETINNNLSSNLSSNSQEFVSTISLKQIGDENIARIDDRVSLGEHKVYQIGNRNNYQFINYENNMPINLGVLQTGDENLLKIKGTNSIFKNLKIAQFGGAKMNIINF